MEKSALCFVDDDLRELKRFHNALKNKFVIGIGQNADSALADLRKKGREKPDIFLVDLYFPSGGPIGEEQSHELYKAWSTFLEEERKLKKVLAGQGQSSEGGFRIARDLYKNYKIDVVFFSRKGTLEDAISSYEDHHALAVIKKPDPKPDIIDTSRLQPAYDKAMEEASDIIAGQISRAIRRSTWWGKYHNEVISFIIGVVSGILSSAMWYLIQAKCFTQH